MYTECIPVKLGFIYKNKKNKNSKFIKNTLKTNLIFHSQGCCFDNGK